MKARKHSPRALRKLGFVAVVVAVLGAAALAGPVTFSGTLIDGNAPAVHPQVTNDSDAPEATDADPLGLTETSSTDNDPTRFNAAPTAPEADPSPPSPPSPPGPMQFALTVDRDGNGGGTITSAPAGISCGATCSANFAYGTIVTLTAVSNNNSTFAGWSGACSGSGACAVTMTSAHAVTATFELLPQTPQTLTVQRIGGGSGTVTSTPAGIDCGATCSAVFAAGTIVTLTASPTTGSHSGGWIGGGCSGAGPCVVTMSSAQTVTANFDLDTYRVTSWHAGTGGGTVTSAPAGINCGSACFADYYYGTVVTLTATADAGSTFTGWSEIVACAGTGTGTCTFTVRGNEDPTATFEPILTEPFVVGLTVVVNGAGLVTDTTDSVFCSATCTTYFAPGTVLTLNAIPSGDLSFWGWFAACTGVGTCTITLTSDTVVGAVFEPA